jgi:hypothetical protein
VVEHLPSKCGALSSNPGTANFFKLNKTYIEKNVTDVALPNS